jgi:hypothetical protein
MRDCGESCRRKNIATLLNVVEATFAALAAENEAMKSFGIAEREMHND